jgi:hypothetical protein
VGASVPPTRVTTVGELGMIDALMVRLLSLWGPGAWERPSRMHPRLGCVTTLHTSEAMHRGDSKPMDGQGVERLDVHGETPLFFLRCNICEGVLCWGGTHATYEAVRPVARETT